MRLETYFAGAFSCVAAASSTIGPTAVVAAGTIVGVRTSLPSSTVAVNKFVGIPYAEPPVGSKRFMPPAPLATFGTEPFNATQSVHSCYQQGGSVSAAPIYPGQPTNLEQATQIMMSPMKTRTASSLTCTPLPGVPRPDGQCCSGSMGVTYRMDSLAHRISTAPVSPLTTTSWL